MGEIPDLIFDAKTHSRITAANPGMQVIIRRKTVNILSGLENAIEVKMYSIVKNQMSRTGLFTLPNN
jgi:hypothetical protein